MYWGPHSELEVRKLKLEENVASIWPEFESNRKNSIKVHHLLNHTSGLHNALANLTRENPLLMSDWDECLNLIAMSAPETEPGHEQLYHYLSFGWLVGGIIEVDTFVAHDVVLGSNMVKFEQHASGKKFQEILEEAFIHPLQIGGELYVGIPPGMIQNIIFIILAYLSWEATGKFTSGHYSFDYSIVS
ncbi:unnamed protein product [Ilex paraguariensis]|uniref:Beta-lactamase-related domain-containing protein n=1 Tax=Ilex paraguariensis TaxID=185542 RepID=A0ABC8UX03_9AQUA